MLGLALTGAMCKVKFSGEVPDGSGIRSVAKPGGQWRVPLVAQLNPKLSADMLFHSKLRSRAKVKMFVRTVCSSVICLDGVAHCSKCEYLFSTMSIISRAPFFLYLAGVPPQLTEASNRGR
jgi:hypothetical protein